MSQTKGCSSMRQVSKIIIIMFCMLLLPHSTDTTFQMSTQEQNVMTSLNRDVLLSCIFRTQGDFVDTESIIVTWSHNNKEIARYKDGDVLNTSKAFLFETELQRGNASLCLRNVQVEDKGEYICHVVDVPDEGKIKVRLEGVELPKVMIDPDTLVRGKDQIISCIIDGHFPEEISITLKKNGVPLRKTAMKDHGTFITSESLMLNSVDENDEFTCEVKVMNEIISTTKKFKFTGNSISLAVIGNIVLSIILILILMLIAFCIWHIRKNFFIRVMRRDDHPAPGEQIVKLGECLKLKVKFKDPVLGGQTVDLAECGPLNDV